MLCYTETLPCDPVLRHGWDEFFVMHAKLRAKVLLFFDICKLFLHIARNQHEIAENIYKEDRKNCYAGSSFQFVRRVSLFTSLLFAPLPH